jgi:hypothetical protein
LVVVVVEDDPERLIIPPGHSRTEKAYSRRVADYPGAPVVEVEGGGRPP